jgi:hypothetical protein
MISDTRKNSHRTIVDPGQTPMIVATGIAAIDRGPDYVQVTFAFDQMFG